MSPSNKCQLLVVDDFDDNLFLITLFFESENYQVESATSGQEALEKLEISRPDIVLMDVRLPDVSGLELTKQIRQKPKLINLPIILVTGDADIQLEDVLKIGATNLFHKPLDLTALLEQVKTICSPISPLPN